MPQTSESTKFEFNTKEDLSLQVNAIHSLVHDKFNLKFDNAGFTSLNLFNRDELVNLTNEPPIVDEYPNRFQDSVHAVLQHINIERKKVPSLIPLQEWEGYVTDIYEDKFLTSLIDITAKEDVATEEAEFDIEELSDSDKNLLKVGAVFRWIIGYERTPSGVKKRVSQVVFRRLPQWSQSSIRNADRKSKEIIKTIKWT